MRRAATAVFILAFILSVPAAQADWSADQRLTWNSGVSQNPDIAVDSSGQIHIVWHDSTSGNSEIYYKKSTDGGMTWSPNKRLTWTSGGSYTPAIAVDKFGVVHVVWCDDTPGNAEIYYGKSVNGGTTWLPKKRLTWTAGTSDDPAIVVDDSGLAQVVFDDDTSGNRQIYYLKNFVGIDWLASKRITWTSSDALNSAIAVDSSGNFHVIWEDDKPGNSEIYYRKSEDGGDTWTAIKRLTWTSGPSGSAGLAFDATDTIHLAWQDTAPGNYEIYYRKSTDGGATWTAIKRLTWTSGDSMLPCLAADSSANIHVVWQDDTPGNKEIYYKKSTSGGADWEAGQNLTKNSSWSNRPGIAAGPSESLYVVWDEALGTNWEIYFKKYEKE